VKRESTIYRYGPIAWFWRLLIVPAALGGGLSLWLGVRHDEPWMLVSAAALLGPAFFFGTVLAVRIERIDGSRLCIHTLLFWRRYLDRSGFGRPRFFTRYHAEHSLPYAPRLWQPVRGRLPIYIDLLGEIPNTIVFRRFFDVPSDIIQSRRLREAAKRGYGVTLDPDADAAGGRDVKRVRKRDGTVASD